MTDPTSLLSIDVDAEIRKLCGRQHASRAEMMVELVRLLVRYGAQRIDINVRRAATRLVAPGAEVSPDVLRELRTIRDPAADVDARHRALTVCEAQGATPLLALLVNPVLSVRAPAGTLDITPGQARFDASAVTSELMLSTRADTAAAARRTDRAALGKACRFARVPISLNGELLSHGDDLGDIIGVQRFEDDDLEGLVALPRSGDVCHAVYLVQEIVARETFAVSPRGNVHLAVLRDGRATGADDIRRSTLSDLVRPTRRRLVEQLEKRFVELDPRDRLALREHLFLRAKRSGSSEPLGRLPLFRRLEGGPVDVTELRAAVTDGVLLAVESREAPRRGAWIGDPKQIFWLDQRERAFISEHLGCRIAEPPIRMRDGWRERAALALSRTTRVASRFVRRAGYVLLAGGPVDPIRLSGEERRWLEGVQELLASGVYRLPGLSVAESREATVVLVSRGALPARIARRGARPKVLIPHRDSLVQKMVDAYVADSGVLYPAMAALFAGHDGFGGRKEAVQERLLAAEA